MNPNGKQKRIAFPREFPPLAIVARLVAAVPLGFTAISMVVALLGRLVGAAGVPRGQAVVLSAMAGFLMYLVWLIWAFAARKLIRVYVAALLASVGSAGLLWLNDALGR